MTLIKTKEVKFRFKEITYKALDTSVTDDIEIEYKYFDSIEETEIGEVSSRIVITRSVFFEPSILFDLKISIEVIVDHEELIHENDDEWTNNITNELVESALLSSAFVRLSALVTDISAAQGNNPIITSPNYSPK